MTLKKSKISVILPAFNRERVIADAVKSVLDQTYQNWELLIIDDGSTDQTGLIADKFALSEPRIKVFHTANFGVSHARNLGITKSTGEWICFLDSDDLLEVNALEAMIDNSDNVNLVAGDFKTNDILSKSRQWISEDIRFNDVGEMGDLVLSKIWIFTYTVWACIIKKSFIKVLFNEHYKYCEDTLFMAHLLSQMKPFRLIKDVVYFYRRGNQYSLSQQLESADLNVLTEITNLYLKIFKGTKASVQFYCYFLNPLLLKIGHIANDSSLSYEEKASLITSITKMKFPNDLRVGKFDFTKELQRKANLLLIGDADLILRDYGITKNCNTGITNPVLKSNSNWCPLKIEDKSKIKKISFLKDNKNAHSYKFSYSWDGSIKGRNSIIVYLSCKMNDLKVVGNGSSKIKASSSMNKMFADFENLEEIEGLDLIDTSDVEDMSYLFYHCHSLKKLDLSSWDTSKVKNFRGTFCLGHNQVGDAKIREINLKGWNTSSAEDMAYMFYGCGSLKHLDVSSFDTSNVTNFRHTFADCFSLKKLDVSKWNTSKVKTLDGIFNDCRSIKQFDISSWDTSNVEEFDQLFDNCKSLKEIKGLDKLNTSSGFSFEEMFFGCKSLRRLDLSSIDTRKVDGHSFVAFNSSIESTSNMNRMLDGCDNLRHVKVGNNFVIPAFDKSSNKILEGLKDNGYVVVTPMSSSMWPLLRKKKDQAVFKKVDKYRKNDVVLYKSDFSSDLVMHRIKRELSNGYIIKGDKANNSEFVFKEYVFAKAIEIYRKNENIKCDSIKFKILSFLSITYDYFYLRYRRYKKHHKK